MYTFDSKIVKNIANTAIIIPMTKIFETMRLFQILFKSRKMTTRNVTCMCGIKKYRSTDLHSCHSLRTSETEEIRAILICIFHKCRNKSVGRNGIFFPAR